MSQASSWRFSSRSRSKQKLYRLIPNTLTTIRLLLIIPYVTFFILGHRFNAAIVYIIALVTDIDGTIARKLNAVTTFGAFFDPAVDATFMVIALSLLVVDGSVLVWPAAIYVVAALFRLLPALGHFKRSRKVRTTYLSKTIAFSGFTTVLLGTFSVSHWITTTLLIIGACAHIILGVAWLQQLR